MMAIYIIFHPHNNNNIKEENKLLRLAIIFCSFLPGAGFSFSHYNIYICRLVGTSTLGTYCTIRYGIYLLHNNKKKHKKKPIIIISSFAIASFAPLLGCASSCCCGVHNGTLLSGLISRKQDAKFQRGPSSPPLKEH